LNLIAIRREIFIELTVAFIYQLRDRDFAIPSIRFNCCWNSIGVLRAKLRTLTQPLPEGEKLA
jgi:hypothetical protein